MPIGELVRTIQYVLAPAVMVSSAALLLLGFQNKFSNLAARFRSLNQELRKLKQNGSALAAADTARLESLERQLHHLARRGNLVKNSIVCTYLAIACFTGTSVLIFCSLYEKWALAQVTVLVFIAGFFFLLVASWMMIREAMLFHKIIMIEKQG